VWRGYLCIRSEKHSFNRFRNIENDAKFRNWVTSHTHTHTHLGGNLKSVNKNCPQSVSMRYLKSVALSATKIWHTFLLRTNWPCDLDLWPFDPESGVRVTCDVRYLCTKFEKRSLNFRKKFQNWVMSPTPRPLRGQFAIYEQELPAVVSMRNLKSVALSATKIWHIFLLRPNWPRELDLLTLKVVSESHVTWATSVPILVFLGLKFALLSSMLNSDYSKTVHVIV